MESESLRVELRIPSTTTLVSVALAILIFCGQVFVSGVVTFLPDAVQQVIRPTHSPIAISLLLLALCRTRRNWRVAGVCAVAGVAAALSLPYIKDTIAWELLPLLLCALAVGDSDIAPVVRACFWALLASLSVIVVMDALRLSSSAWAKPNWYWAYSYGFGHPNTMGALLYNTLSTMTLAIDRKRFRLPLLICCVATMCFTFFALSCRTAAVLELILTLAIIIEGIRPDWMARMETSRVLPALVVLGTVALAMLMLAGAAFYSEDNVLFSLVDRLTNLRVSHGKSAYDYVGGFTLLSHAVVLPNQTQSLTTGVEWILVDSSYIHYGLFVGLIPGLCLLLMFIRAACAKRGARDAGNSAMLWVLLGLGALYGVTEKFPIYITRSCALLILAWGLLPKARNRAEGAACNEPPSTEEKGVASPSIAHPASALRTISQVVGMVIFGAVLVLLTYQALGNGTGKVDVSEEFPQSVRVVCADGLVKGDWFANGVPGADAEGSGLGTLVQADFSAGEQVQGSLLGNPIDGLLQKIGTRGNAVRYLVSPANHDDDPVGGQWGIYLLAPGRGDLGTEEGRWALCMINYRTNTTRSIWLNLKHNGAAVCGCAEQLDATVAKDEDLVPYEQKGTWQTVERYGATYVDCTFGNKQLSIAIRGEDA